MSRLSYTVADAAEVTGVSSDTIRDEINHNRLKAKRIGRRVLILATDLQAWLDNLSAANERSDP